MNKTNGEICRWWFSGRNIQACKSKVFYLDFSFRVFDLGLRFKSLNIGINFGFEFRFRFRISFRWRLVRRMFLDGMESVKRIWLWRNWNEMLLGLTTCLVDRIGTESVKRIGMCLFGSHNVALELEWNFDNGMKYWSLNTLFF